MALADKERAVGVTAWIAGRTGPPGFPVWPCPWARGCPAELGPGSCSWAC